MIDVDADAAAIMAAGDFSQDAIVDGRAIKGNFTDATDSTNLIDGRVEANRPTLVCLTADIVGIAARAAVTVAGRNFTVERNERLGIGLNTLYLKT